MNDHIELSMQKEVLQRQQKIEMFTLTHWAMMQKPKWKFSSKNLVIMFYSDSVKAKQGVVAATLEICEPLKNNCSSFPPALTRIPCHLVSM